MTAILGLNAFHADAAACLLIDGKLVGAVAEERLGPRVKHSSAFPEHAIRWLLKDNGLRMKDITHVALPRDRAANALAKFAYVLRHPLSGISSAREHFSRARATNSVLTDLAMILDADPADARFETVCVEHHLAHIASSYYCSPFDDLTAGFSYDASGDFASAMAASCEGTRIDIIDRVRLPDSLGFFYTSMCQFIGFDRFGEEYKVMGLAPYGNDAYHEEMENLLSLPDDGWYRLAPGYFGMHSGGRSGATDSGNQLVLDDVFTEDDPALWPASAAR